MKNQTFALTILSALIFAIPVSGELMEYTFVGTIEQVLFTQVTTDLNNGSSETDNALPQEFTEKIGQLIKCQFRVDTELPGYSIGSDGSIIEKVPDTGIDPYYDPSGEAGDAPLYYTSWSTDFFYAELVSDMLIDESPGTEYAAYSTYSMSSTFSMDFSEDEKYTGAIINLFSGSNNHSASVYMESASIDDWLPGSKVSFKEYQQFVQTTENSSVSTITSITSSGMTLSSITKVTDVPEPSSGTLLMCGLTVVAAAGLFRRSARKRI